MKSAKRLIIMLVALCMIGGAGRAEAMRIDGVSVDESLYCLAYFNARYAAGVSGMPDDPETLHQQARLGCARMITIERLSQERGVALGNAGSAYIEQMMRMYWPSISEKYQENGITEAAWRRYLEICTLETELFKRLYGKGGELAWDDADLQAKYERRFAKMEYVGIPCREMRADGIEYEAVLAIAQYGLARLSDGADMEAVLDEIKERAGAAYADRVYLTRTWVDTDGDETGTYSEAFLQALNQAEPGAYGQYETPLSILLYRVLPKFETSADFEDMRMQVIRDLCYGEYENYLEMRAESCEITFPYNASVIP